MVTFLVILSREMNKNSRFTSTDSFIWIIIGIAIVLFIGGVFYLAGSSKKQEGEDLVQFVDNNTESYFKGSSDAKVILVEFSDFECLACAQYSQILRQIDESYRDDVKIVFRHFPLESIHENAMFAANAAEAAGTRGKFWKMHDIVYEKQSEWNSLSGDELLAKFLEYASEIGINDIDEFSKEIRDTVYQEKINKDLDAANQLNLNSTPTIFLNGVQLSNSTFSNLEKEIAAILEE